MKSKLHSLFSVLLLAGFSTAPAQAQQSLSTVIQADGGNYYAPGHSISTKILATGGSSLSNTYAFTGLDRNGATGTMSYIVNAKAVASYGSIGASFSATLSNTIYNANNVQWVTNSSGVPDYFDGQADASFTDTLTVQGGSGLSSIKLLPIRIRLRGLVVSTIRWRHHHLSANTGKCPVRHVC